MSAERTSAVSKSQKMRTYDASYEISKVEYCYKIDLPERCVSSYLLRDFSTSTTELQAAKRIDYI